MEYYDLDETYKEYEEYKYKEYQGKCLKNFSGGVNVRGVFVLGGNCPGGICPGVIVRGVIVLIPGEDTGVKWARFMTTRGNYCNDY